MITIFSSPTKNSVAQRNAVRSWLSLRVDQQVILSGNKEIAASTDTFYVEDNPLEYGKNSIFLFVDPRVIVFDSLVAAIYIVSEAFPEGYLVIGGVTKLEPKEIDFEDNWDLDLIRDVNNYGEECGGIGYYGFPKGLYEGIVTPGRDMIDHAIRLAVPVVNITQYAPTVYQGIASPPRLLGLSTHTLTSRGIIELRR